LFRWKSATKANWLKLRHWRNGCFLVSDPPHLRRLQLAWGHALADAGQQFVLVASNADWWHRDAWLSDERSARFVGREFMGVGYYALRVFLSAPREAMIASDIMTAN
jgi:hypothetical protein